MRTRRFISTTAPDGSVHVHHDTPLEDSDTSRGVIALWGWDRLPSLPLSPEAVAAGLDRPTLFAPPGGANVAIAVFGPANEQRGTEGADLAHANVVSDPSDPLLHRTDTVDVIFVLDGEITLEQPGQRDLALERGDFVVLNGNMHRWTNHGERRAVLGTVTTTVARQPDA